MRKIGIIVALGLALLLGLTWSAGAVTIDDTSGETYLFQIANGWLGTGYGSSQAFADAYPILDTLPQFSISSNQLTYTITAYATFAGFTQDAGYSLISGGPNFVSFSSLVPALTINNTDGIYPPNVDPDLPFAFTPTGDFAFGDKLTNDGGVAGTKYTHLSFNPGSPTQSNGLAFLIDATHLIVAFEDGYNSQPYGDKDYNDLVLNITLSDNIVPIPATLPLLGSGLLGLIGLGWWRRKS